MRDQSPAAAAVRPAAAASDGAGLERLIGELGALRASMLDAEARLLGDEKLPRGGAADSARNLAHFLALRSFDLRDVQERLAALGLSSLGRAEPQVLASVDRVLELLRLLAGRPPSVHVAVSGSLSGLLEQRAEQLFGPRPAGQRARIMVTLPPAAAADDDLVARLVQGGMDVARINCAHDDAEAWIAMAASVRRAARTSGRGVKVLMDLAGPKLRTGPIAPPPPVLRLRPQRDGVGAVLAPWRLGLYRAGRAAPTVPGATAQVGVDPAWLDALQVADQIDLVDARGSKRRLVVLARGEDWALVEGSRTAYLTPTTQLRLLRRANAGRVTDLHDLPASPGRLLLRPGDRLRLARAGLGHDTAHGAAGPCTTVATVACTLPEALDQVRAGERIWFDDGRIGGIVRRVTPKWAEIEIDATAAEEGARLGADKGINFPDTRLELPALTAKDLDDLATVAGHADLVGLSFAQDAADVRLLRRHLRRLGAGDLGIVLKIETRRGFEHLPELLLAALACPSAGIMIARGDLAVECGFERLAEVQEEILWACEAAHTPVIWATQVLESEARSGLPSRAEITDAAMGARAECVMLNKGPHILAALRSLDDILCRMQGHQAKKRPLLRALKAWEAGGADLGVAA